jgi:hypothetical protein
MKKPTGFQIDLRTTYGGEVWLNVAWMYVRRENQIQHTWACWGWGCCQGSHELMRCEFFTYLDKLSRGLDFPFTRLSAFPISSTSKNFFIKFSNKANRFNSLCEKLTSSLMSIKILMTYKLSRHISSMSKFLNSQFHYYFGNVAYWM